MRLKREGDFIALQVWLPFIIDTHNQGVSGDNNTVSAATFGSGGKIGSGYLSGGTITIPAATSKTFFNKTGMSFAFWLYPIGTSGSGAIMGQESMAQGDNRMYTIFQYPTPNDLHLSWQDNTANNTTFLSGTWTGFFPADTWTHFCVTFDGTNALIYRNGVQYGSVANRVTNRTSFEYNYSIRGSSRAKLNDVRIYDHCLSLKEIKEIAKGLVCHYTLSNGGNANLHKNSNTITSTWNINQGTVSNGVVTITPTSNSDRRIYQMPASGGWSWQVNKTYTASIDARSDNGATLTFVPYGAGSMSKSYDVTSDWKRYSFTFTATQSGTASMTYHVNQSSGVSLQLRRPKLEESLMPTPWIPNSTDVEYTKLGFNDVIEYDVSGYEHNGTKVGDIEYLTNTPKYWGSTYFKTGSGIFTHLNITLTQFTISFWGKHTATGKMLFGSNVSPSSVNSTWYWYGDNSFKYPSGEFYYEHNAGTADSFLNKWTHFVAVYDGTKITVYRNGVYEGNKAVTGNMLLDYASVGNGYISSNYWENGGVSDFRIYATALSADDILELYNTPISLTSNGVLMTHGELTEV